MIAGVLTGLGAAGCQSLSYILGKRVVRDRAGGSVRLLVYAHAWMGLFSLLALPWLWPGAMPPARALAWPLAATTLFYLGGQASLFKALARSDASRVSPLLGLKIVLLALISALALGATFSGAQWTAVGIAALAAVCLSRAGGALPKASLGWILLACANFSLSDLHIKMLVDLLQSPAGGPGLVRASAFGAGLSYALSGLFAGGAFCLWRARLRPADRALWRGSLPFALAWFAAMFFLFTTFGLIGPVYGNIVQSTRGLISTGLGFLLARAGFVHLEARVGPRAWLYRAGAAALMIGAIALFGLGG
jgi:uncharacterized membrane protein